MDRAASRLEISHQTRVVRRCILLDRNPVPGRQHGVGVAAHQRHQATADRALLLQRCDLLVLTLQQRRQPRACRGSEVLAHQLPLAAEGLPVASEQEVDREPNARQVQEQEHPGHCGLGAPVLQRNEEACEQRIGRKEPAKGRGPIHMGASVRFSGRNGTDMPRYGLSKGRLLSYRRRDEQPRPSPPTHNSSRSAHRTAPHSAMTYPDHDLQAHLDSYRCPGASASLACCTGLYRPARP